MIHPCIDHVGLNVRDLDESIRFYAELLGFDVIQRWDEPKQAFIGKGHVALGLMEISDYDFSVYTLAHLAFSCDPEAFPVVVQAIENLGAKIVSGPKPQRDGETILFRDPSGNILEVCYPPLLG